MRTSTPPLRQGLKKLEWDGGILFTKPNYVMMIGKRESRGGKIQNTPSHQGVRCVNPNSVASIFYHSLPEFRDSGFSHFLGLDLSSGTQEV